MAVYVWGVGREGMGVVTHFSITRCLHQTHDKGFALLESVKNKDVSYFYR